MKQAVGYQKKFLLVIVAVALLIFFHLTGILEPIENILVSVVKPTTNLSHSLGAGLNEVYDQNTDKRDLLSLLQTKEEENKSLILANAQLQYLKEENELLRQYHNFYEQTNFDYLLARVIVENLVNNDPAEHTKIIINKGSYDGLIPGLLALDQSGMIIGRLTKVDKNKSIISLITSPDCKLAIAIQYGGQIMGVAQGDAGLTVKINFIPQTEAVRIGDSVVTSGLEENLPAGMILGKIEQINRESNELWQNAVVRPMSDLDNLIIVSILLPQSIVQAE